MLGEPAGPIPFQFAAKQRSSSRSVRKLWGKGKGSFRTEGRRSSATVRGTWWLVEDRCDGTFTRVRQGTVDVRDFALQQDDPAAGRQALPATVAKAVAEQRTEGDRLRDRPRRCDEDRDRATSARTSDQMAWTLTALGPLSPASAS